MIYSHLDLYQFQVLWDILNLARRANYLWKLAHWLIHQFHLVLKRSRALPDCVPRFWWKMGYPWSWRCSRVHPQYRRARHPSSNRIRLSTLHHMSWRQSCCCCIVSLLSLSSNHSSRISALSLNLEKSNNWKHLELCLVSSWVLALLSTAIIRNGVIREMKDLCRTSGNLIMMLAVRSRMPWHLTDIWSN